MADTKEDLTCPSKQNQVCAFHADLEGEITNQRKWRLWFMVLLIVNTFLSGGNVLGKISSSISERHAEAYQAVIDVVAVAGF